MTLGKRTYDTSNCRHNGLSHKIVYSMPLHTTHITRAVCVDCLHRFRAHGLAMPTGLDIYRTCTVSVPHTSSSCSHASGLVAAAAADPPEVLTLLFDPLNQVIITGGNDGAIKVSDGNPHTGYLTSPSL